jgi:hypothetical protein
MRPLWARVSIGEDNNGALPRRAGGAASDKICRIRQLSLIPEDNQTTRTRQYDED